MTKITVLGCASSMGTPAAGGFWGNCDPDEPKNERTRASILVESAETTVMVDTTVDTRLQLNRARPETIDAILYTHAHSDHINGLDDLRLYSFKRGKPIDVYSNAETIQELHDRFAYVFKGGGDGVYRPFLQSHVIQDPDFMVGDIEVRSFDQDHGTCTSLGFRFGDFAYCVDVIRLDEPALDKLRGVKTLMVDCAAYHKDQTNTHANLKQVLEWVDILKPEMTYLIDLTTMMDYKTLCEELPDHIRPAYDGLEIEIS